MWLKHVAAIHKQFLLKRNLHCLRVVLINKPRDMKLFQLLVKAYELKKLCEVYIYCAFNNAVSSSDYTTALND